MKETELSAFLQMRDAHYENEYTYLEKLNRELREGGNLAKQSENKIQNDMSNTPKIEGPVLIEFHADSEKDEMTTLYNNYFISDKLRITDLFKSYNIFYT
ncbi:Nucleoporin NUP82 [Dirofilaria immitis]